MLSKTNLHLALPEIFFLICLISLAYVMILRAIRRKISEIKRTIRRFTGHSSIDDSNDGDDWIETKKKIPFFISAL